MPFLDFAAIKARVKIEDAASALRLVFNPHGEQLRGPCPTCRRGGDRALVLTPSKGLWYCFAAQKGGDVIALWAHIRDMGVKDAAQQLLDAFGTVQEEPSTVSSTVRKSRATAPQNQKPGKPATFDPDAFLQKLASSADVGLSDEDAVTFRAGVYKGVLYVPAVYPSGAIAGFWKVIDGKLIAPPKWLPDTNVVRLVPKKTA